MVDPAHVEVEADIEDTRRFLKRYIESESWKADPDGFAGDMGATIDEVEVSNMPDWAKTLARFALLQQMKKRRGKPKRRYRNMAIELAAMRLVVRGYMATRNDVTHDRDSASSIIRQALHPLGEELSEKSINAIITDSCRTALQHPDVLRDVLK
jgi:hypothetical protein